MVLIYAIDQWVSQYADCRVNDRRASNYVVVVSYLTYRYRCLLHWRWGDVSGWIVTIHTLAFSCMQGYIAF